MFFWLKDDGNQRAKTSFNNNKTPAWANKTKKKKYHSSVLIYWGKFRNRTFNNRISNDKLFSLELGNSKENKNFKLQISHQVSACQRQLVYWYYQFHILLATNAAQKNLRKPAFYCFCFITSRLRQIERTSVRCWFDNLGLETFVKWLFLYASTLHILRSDNANNSAFNTYGYPQPDKWGRCCG